MASHQRRQRHSLRPAQGIRYQQHQLQQYADNGGDNQRWLITPTSDGYFVISSKASGTNDDVDSISTKDGAEIHQYQNTGSDNQLWSLATLCDD